MTTSRRVPVFGSLAAVAPLVGFYLWWRIVSDNAGVAGDYTGLGVPLAIFINYGPCLLLGTIFVFMSLRRRETPRQLAWVALGVAWAPVVLGFIRSRLHL